MTIALCLITSSLLLPGAALAAGHRAGAARARAPRHVLHLTARGTANLRALAAHHVARGSVAREGAPRTAPLRFKSEPLAPVPVPNPPSSPVVTSVFGFAGLTAAQNHSLNGFDLEPPDQGLCAHGGTVLETVNLAVAAYSESGARLVKPVSLNALFGLAPSFNKTTGTYGPFVSDPRCYYDTQTARWFLTALEIDTNPQTGAFADRSSELIAVSQTSDPTGTYRRFSIDTTNNGTRGTPSEPNCPCFGDQPRIGADAHGFYISTDSYPIVGLFNSNGGELYAISKQGLAAAAKGTATMPPVVAIHVGGVTIGGYPANAVQPAETPQGAAYPSNREYFLSTPDFNGFATMGGQGAQAIVLWTLSNTASLSGPTPSVTLTNAIVPSEPFAPPVQAVQKDGVHPLGQSLGEPVPPISVNDDRMQQVEYLNHQLVSSLSTGVGSGGTADHSGAALFDVATHGTGGTMLHQGYLAAPSPTSLLYPAIGLNRTGAGVVTFSLSGPSNYPSAAYVPFSLAGGPGSPISVNGPGTRPEDGFTCYHHFGFGPPCRWGDYSAATADGNLIVMADEMIPNAAPSELANWGTWISTFKP